MIIGRITRPHGIRGEIRVEIHTEQPDRFITLERVLVGETELLPMTVESARFHQNVIILKLGNCDTRTQAEGLKGKKLLIPIEEAIPLEEDEYFLFQLIGLEVQTEEKQVLGEIVDIIETGANDVFVVDGPSGQLLLPDIPEVILDVNLDDGIVIVQLLPGLRDE
ncbi:MAG: 16S rRNA processing protein RimM [Anaerolineales bacterium]|nr:16S rRNA processing protein RimM [Anaerolineales bacterium]